MPRIDGRAMKRPIPFRVVAEVGALTQYDYVSRDSPNDHSAVVGLRSTRIKVAEMKTGSGGSLLGCLAERRPLAAALRSGRCNGPRSPPQRC
jgi:hypothetical protein